MYTILILFHMSNVMRKSVFEVSDQGADKNGLYGHRISWRLEWPLSKPREPVFFRRYKRAKCHKYGIKMISILNSLNQ